MKTKILALFTVLALFTGAATAQLGTKPKIQEYRQPDISVNQEENTVTATFYLENTGGSFANIDDESWIIEIQPQRTNSFNFLLSQAGVSQPRTCDDSKEKNVHKAFVFTQGEKKQISITSPLNGEGSLKPGTYSLKALTVTGCTIGDTAEENVQAVEPYRWGTQVGTFTVKEDTTNRDPGDGDDTTTDKVWISYSNSQTCVQVAQNKVPTNLETYDTKKQCVENTEGSGFPIVLIAIGPFLVLAAGIVYWRLDIFG